MAEEKLNNRMAIWPTTSTKRVTAMTGDRTKIEAFIEYAMDHEGMEYTAVRSTRTAAGPARYTAEPVGNYDPQVMAAVERNFREEWKAFVGE